jgi:DNA-binding transcriptional regulator YiaG
MKSKNKSTWDREHIRALRKQLKLTQQELAKEMGVRQQTVSDWETGVYQPRGASATILSIVAERAGFEYKTDSKEAKDGQDSY